MTRPPKTSARLSSLTNNAVIDLSKKQLLGLSTPVNYVVLTNILLIIASRFVYSAITDRDSEYVVVPILQMLVFILPAMLYLWLGGANSMSASRLRLRVPRFSHLTLIVAATMMLITGGLLLSIIFGGIDSLRSNFSLYETFVSKNGRGFGNTVYLVFAYALLPAVCEEMTYRSLLCSEYESRGFLCSVGVSALFFGILHLNARMLPVYIFAGILLALTMYATRSVLCSIAVHFLYNLFCIFSQPLVTTFYRSTSSAGLFVVLVILLFMLSAALFCFSASRLYAKYAKAKKQPPYPTGLSAGETLRKVLITLCDLPTSISIVLFFITVFTK